MKSTSIFLFFLTTLFKFSHAQSISGNLSLLANQEIQLEGFSGLKTYPISNTTIDEKGNFKLNYSKADYGVGYLIAADEKPFFVILSGEDVEITGEALSQIETVKIIKSKENQLFEQYAQEHPRREQALSAWIYLEKIYTLDSLFSVQQTLARNIQTEKQRIKKEDTDFLNSLPKDSYVSWFLPTRKLVSGVSTIAQYRPTEIPETIQEFRKLDYTDTRLYKSGLFKDAIESHFWLIENAGIPLDSVYAEMKKSIDVLMENLVKDEKKLNEITDYLFDLLERHSLFEASEYLALKVLNEVSCTIDNDLAKQLETYRAMKKGNIAPELFFDGDNIAKGFTADNFPRKLSDIESQYNLVVFGASWCPKCKEELPQIVNLYQKWKNNGLEVVYISLDDNKKDFVAFASSFPFLSNCDYKKWGGRNVENYYVFATPTMFLLDKNKEILLRPISVKQVDAWVDWNLK
jgi:thiol-disulfide isomerase/thioredoxin